MYIIQYSLVYSHRKEKITQLEDKQKIFASDDSGVFYFCVSPPERSKTKREAARGLDWPSQLEHTLYLLEKEDLGISLLMCPGIFRTI